MKEILELKLLNEGDKEFFFRNGFIIVKNVYKKQDLKYAREIFINAFESGVWRDSKYNSSTIINDIYRLYPELVNIIFNEYYINAVKDILGIEVIFLPECAVHHNRYIDWHKDTTSQEMAGILSHKDFSSYLLQCATYFQDNSKYLGGGLSVIPETHLKKDRFINIYNKTFSSRLTSRLKKTFKQSIFHKIEKMDQVIDLPIKTGDLLIFDVRLDHRSTFVSNQIPNNSLKNEKFAIFNTFGCSNNFTKDYLNFMKKRPEPYYEFLNKSTFPEILYKKADELNITIVE